MPPTVGAPADEVSTLRSRGPKRRLVPAARLDELLAGRPGADRTPPARDWPPGLALVFAEMMEKAIDDGFPVVVPVRKDATPEQISQVFEDVRALVERLGLAAAQAANP
ncbi:MAG: hypothetical protein JO345_22270 [Streptosporangiaceae bacterium]|nr:hypothetical protein [Streptosporangiaceae bacterium]